MVSVTYLPNADNICVPGCSWSRFPGDPGIYEPLSLPSFFLMIFFFLPHSLQAPAGAGKVGSPVQAAGPHAATRRCRDVPITSSAAGSNTGELLQSWLCRAMGAGSHRHGGAGKIRHLMGLPDLTGADFRPGVQGYAETGTGQGAQGIQSCWMPVHHHLSLTFPSSALQLWALQAPGAPQTIPP